MAVRPPLPPHTAASQQPARGEACATAACGLAQPESAATVPTAAGSTAVCMDHLDMRFGPTCALHDVCATVPQGGITGLVGPDAAGKTTLMRLLAGLMAPTGGRLEIFGRPPLDVAATAPNTLGYMPQHFGLYEDLSVLDNLRLHARLRGVEGAAREALFAELLRFTLLEPFTGRLAGKLSGGMKQKLGIACALLGSPRLLLLDEPGVGVDPLSRRDLWRMVQELADKGMTIIWATAYLEEAERCPHVIMLDEGRLLYAGPPEQLTASAEGKVFLLSPPQGQKRRALSRWTSTAGVADSLIQGRRVRVVLKQDAEAAACLAALQQEGAQPAAPRLEDAYMLALGGCNQTPSVFAADVDAPITQAAPRPRIEARGLTKRFGSFTAAQDITFSVPAGRIFGLLGPNGAGKSTTFRMLCGLSRPTAGSCFVDGLNLLSAGGAARTKLGYMAQKFSLYTDLQVRENIAIFGSLYGLSGAELHSRAHSLCAALELEHWLDTATGLLPLGQKQRLALLCATLHRPAVLFLDEPTSGVDARTRRDFWKHITAMTRAGASVLVTTHFMEEAEYCDTVALVYNGKIISMGAPDALKAAGATPEQSDPTMEEAFISCILRYNEEHAQ